MKNKIILGSANFDQKYGIRKNSITKKEIQKSFKLALKSKIKTIDTSPLYNKSEKIIGLINNKRFKIISKIYRIPKNIRKKNIEKWIKQYAMISLNNLKIKKFECLVIHDENLLLTKNGKEIYNSIKNIKTSGLTNKIGISIYDFNILDKILRKFKFDLVQTPLNILDQRLVETGWLKKLKKRKIEVHARSIFLQGILLAKHNRLPKKLKKLSNNWIKWKNWLKNSKLNSLQVCLSFVLNQRQLDGIVIGYNSTHQLKQILKLKQMKNDFLLPGEIIKILDKKNKAIKVPHIGWKELYPKLKH